MGRAFDIERVRKPQPQPSQRRTKRRSGIGWWLLLLVCLGGAGYWAYTQGVMPTDPNPLVTATPTASSTPTHTKPIGPTPTPSATVTPTITPEPTPTPSPPVSLAPEDVTLRILNGSASAGQANDLRDELVADGFTVRTTGTAKNRRQTTAIYYRTGAKDKAELVARFIENRVLELFENDTLATPDDVLVVVGTK